MYSMLRSAISFGMTSCPRSQPINCPSAMLQAACRGRSDARSKAEHDPTHTISWYPGHIAKAEKELIQFLKKVDVVIEVRDARIPFATTHPKVPQWIGNRPHIVAIVRTDLVPKVAIKNLKEYYAAAGEGCVEVLGANAAANGNNNNDNISNGNGNGTGAATGTGTRKAGGSASASKVVFLNSKKGTGIRLLKEEIIKSSTAVNERRLRLGMTGRAIRAAVIGYPNVGKSTLINRILGRVVAKAENMPGVTRTIHWIRLGGTGTASSSTGSSCSSSKSNAFELLDSPGIIPPGGGGGKNSKKNKSASGNMSMHSAVLLAICNAIGEASYDKIRIAKALCDALNQMYATHPEYVDMDKISKRYQYPAFMDHTGEQIFLHISENLCRDDENAAANKLLSDFRKGLLGYNALQAPPSSVVLADAAEDLAAAAPSDIHNTGG